MKRLFVLSLILALLVPMISCTSHSNRKLNQAQQAMADKVTENKDKWEMAGDYYCFSIVIYKSGDGAEIDCTYTDEPRLNLAGGHAFIAEARKSFYVTTDSVEVGSYMDPSSLGKTRADGLSSLGSTGYSVLDGDSTKQKSIESLFLNYK